ncbi:MAG: EI24 domain-containing protein [Deltaproteobacteria bacterium]|jgi:CysZ protein
MFAPVRAFSEGLKFHIRGIRFGFGHASLLALSMLPFLVTLILYIFAFYVFTLYADDMLRMVWHVETGESSTLMGWLYWAYVHVVKVLLYLVVLVVMLYTFLLLSNVLASPIYDHISTKYKKSYYQHTGPEQETSPGKGVLTIMKEEIKKAMLMVVVPLPLLFIPLVGAVLAFVVASIFIAWDYVDFSLSKDCPLLRDRLRAVWRHKVPLFGFGCPLLIPFFGVLIMPFAILGSTLLYFDRMKDVLKKEASSPVEGPLMT